MGNRPDVRVRLSAEGQKEVIDAFKKIQAQQTGKIGGKGLDSLSGSLSNLSRLVPPLTFAGASHAGTAPVEGGPRAGRSTCACAHNGRKSVQTKQT